MVFSRNDQGKSEVLNVEHVVTESMKMLRSVLPSSIIINTDFEKDIPLIKIDAIQLQQIMMNLCLNSRDAMAGEGVLDIKLKTASDIQSECIACHKEIAGDWFELSVSDTGTGIDSEILERIFDPFFTTKEVGKGTGMGLSMIHTIVDSHHGHILIETEKEVGTTFRLLFPPVFIKDINSQDPSDSIDTIEYHIGHGERILVVDDEPSMAHFVSSMLNSKGYRCDALLNSIEALELFRSDVDKYDLIISDQTMPGMTGVNLIAEIHKLKPGFPAILISGYSDSINSIEAEKIGLHYIGKPFNGTDLLYQVAESLNTVEC